MSFSTRIIAAFYILFFTSIASADEVKLYLWEDYLSPNVVDLFEKETGHTVSQVFFDNEDLRDDVILSERSFGYDLIIVDALSLRQMSEKGMMKTFSEAEIPNLSNSSEISLKECGASGIPYAWGVMGIAYRTSKFDKPVTSWMEVLTSSIQHKNKMTVPLDDIDTVAIPLLAMGLDPFTNNIDDLKAAYELLHKMKSNVVQFVAAQTYAVTYREQSDIHLSVAFSGETSLIRDYTGQEDWKFTIPKEGSLIWYECFATRNNNLKKAALEFLNFLQRPEIAALNAQDISYATTNTEALKLVDDAYRNDPELFPDAEALKNSTTYQPITLNGLKMRTRMLSPLRTTQQ